MRVEIFHLENDQSFAMRFSVNENDSKGAKAIKQWRKMAKRADALNGAYAQLEDVKDELVNALHGTPQAYLMHNLRMFNGMTMGVREIAEETVE